LPHPDSVPRIVNVCGLNAEDTSKPATSTKAKNSKKFSIYLVFKGWQIVRKKISRGDIDDGACKVTER